jgi:hypothetical protein
MGKRINMRKGCRPLFFGCVAISILFVTEVLFAEHLSTPILGANGQKDGHDP